MNGELIDFTKQAAYFLWEYIQDDDALRHWYCAEDIACFLESYQILTLEKIETIIKLGKFDFGYIEFTRNIAFRIYIYTNREQSCSNWFAAERLLNNPEWCTAIVNMASIYSSEKLRPNFVNQLRSDKVRQYYSFMH